MKLLFILLFSIILFNIFSKKESFQNFYLAQPTKCFDCEKQLPHPIKYLGGPTKCFSCERDIARRYGIQYSDLGQSSKCFDCEAQMGRNLLR